jgi:hypothetical protein
MSIAQNPLMGPMRKSMGNFTTYSYHGMNIVRSKAFRPKDPKSEKQLNMRARMSGIAVIYQRLSPIISLGFPERKENQSPQNMFVSANFKTAFVMDDATPVISYPLMLLAKGSLPTVTITKATTDADGITLNYDARVLAPDVNADDEIIACVLLKTGQLLKIRQFIGYKPIGTIQLKYPTLQAEQVACCYVFVRSSDGDKASDSVYVEVTD